MFLLRLQRPMRRDDIKLHAILSMHNAHVVTVTPNDARALIAFVQEVINTSHHASAFVFSTINETSSQDPSWYVNSIATSHMCNNQALFQTYVPLPHPKSLSSA